MPSKEQEMREPLPDFVSEVADEATKFAARAGAPDRSNLEALVARFSSFEASAPVDQGVERIVVAKGPNWVPASGQSVKPGNIRFNLGTLFEAIASGVSAGFAAVPVPVVAVFTGLLAIRKLRQAMEVELSERDALVIWSAWSCEQRGSPVTTPEIHRCAAEEARRVGSTLEPSIAEVQQSLQRMEKIGAIRQTGDGGWETIETVVVRT